MRKTDYEAANTGEAVQCNRTRVLKLAVSTATYAMNKDFICRC